MWRLIREPGGTSKVTVVRLGLTVAAIACVLGPPAALADDRLGRTYWARPGIDQVSVDFYAEAALRTRRPVSEKTRFVVEAIETGREFPREEQVYRVKFSSGEIAYIGTGAFEDGLFREPRPGDVVTSVLQPPGGIGIQVYVFERKSIFEDDPDAIAARLSDDGPQRFIPAKPE
jgi:hypothetical protein